jgi:hypothetical protein
MAITKVLGKIQEGINGLAPTLELFVNETIQPSVEDCETLQVQLNTLLENIAVYKYSKQNKELSPSFNIHAKLSAQEIKEEKPEVIEEEVKMAIKIEKDEITQIEEKIELTESLPKQIKVDIIPAQTKTEPIPEPIKKEVGAPKNPLIIGLNDKFRFLNELFSQNNLEYNIALEQLNNLINWNDTEIYLNSLKSLYGWKDNNEAAKQLFSLAKQRFN